MALCGGTSRRHRLACGLPRSDAAIQDLRVAIPHLQELRCPTGSRRIVRSSAVEDDLLILAERRQAGFQFLEGERAVEPKALALGGIVVGACDQRTRTLMVAR